MDVIRKILVPVGFIQIAAAAGDPEAAETVNFLLQHLAASGLSRSHGSGAPDMITFSKP
jgi:hypothetical protein